MSGTQTPGANRPPAESVAGLTFNDCYQVHDASHEGTFYVLLEPVTQRFMMGNTDKWALVREAQSHKGAPVVMMDADGWRQVGIG